MLDDYTEWCWGGRHVSVELQYLCIQPYLLVKVLGFHKGALIFHINELGLFVYHPGDMTLKKFSFDHKSKDNHPHFMHYGSCLHTRAESSPNLDFIVYYLNYSIIRITIIIYYLGQIVNMSMFSI